MRWEQNYPCPPGPVSDYTKDPRYLRSAKGVGEYLRLNHVLHVIIVC